jgi:hypothetical protein
MTTGDFKNESMNSKNINDSPSQGHYFISIWAKADGGGNSEHSRKPKAKKVSKAERGKQRSFESFVSF